MIVLTGLGFYDDYAKITEQSGGGTKPQVKLWVQIALAVFVAIYLWQMPALSELRIPESKTVIKSNLVTTLMVPFYKYPIHLGAMIGIPVIGILLTVLTIVGSSNAVNLTDGLDGLAIGCTLIVSFVFLVLTYLAGNLQDRGLSPDSVRGRRGGVDGILRGDDWARAWAFCGSIVIRRKCSWATPARSRWAARWGSSRC